MVLTFPFLLNFSSFHFRLSVSEKLTFSRIFNFQIYHSEFNWIFTGKVRVESFFPHFSRIGALNVRIEIQWKKNPSNSHMLKRVWHFAIEFIGFQDYFPQCDLSYSSFSRKCKISFEKYKKIILKWMKKVSVMLWWVWVHPNHSLASSCVILLRFLSQVSKTCTSEKWECWQKNTRNPTEFHCWNSWKS